MSWNPLRQPIDKWVLAGRLSPGMGSIEKANSPRKWDEIGGYGASGSVLIFHGRKLVPFDGVLRLYTEEDWADWDAFKPIVLRPPYGSTPKALDIWHPWLQLLEVKSAVVTDVLQPEEIDNGGYRIVIQFLEHRKPKLALAAPVASAPAPQYQDGVDQLIDSMAGQVQELAK